MIAEYLQTQTDISQRAQQIGRIIQSTDYFALQQMLYPCVSPYAHEVSLEYVGIIIGLTDEHDRIMVRVPTPLFETAQQSDIRVWIQRLNAHENAKTNGADDTAAAAKRANEVQMMKELMTKYPEEVNG